MKKFFKYLFFALVCCFCLFSSTNVLNTSSASNIQENKFVFYSDDRLTPIYEYSNLNDGDSIMYNNSSGNILRNSSFVFDSFSGGFPTGSNFLFTNDWYSFFDSTMIYPAYDYLGLKLLQVQGATGNFFVYQKLEVVLLDTEYFINIKINDQVYTTSIITPATLPTYQNNFYSSRLSNNVEVRFNYINGNVRLGTGWYFDIYFYNTDLQATDFVIDYVYLDYKRPLNNSYFSESYLKYYYFNSIGFHPTIEDFSSYFLVYTSDYYDYSFYKDNVYVSDTTNVYIDYIYYPDFVLTTDSITQSTTDIFSSTGQNLLNDINLSSINFDYNYVGLTTSTVFNLNSLYDGFVLGENIVSYYDNLSNYFLYDIDITEVNGEYRYMITLIDYDIHTSSFIVPSFPYDKFLVYNNNSYSLFGGSLGSGEWVSFSNVSFNMFININYNMQYYYADYFGFTYEILNSSSYLLTPYAYDSSSFVYSYSDFVTNPKYFLLRDDRLNSYLIESLFFDGRAKPISFDSFASNTFTSIESAVSFFESKSVSFSFSDPKLYFYQIESNSNSSVLIPSSSSGLYKDKVNWYDFTTDIYNFFIYLLFDAPILSDITKIIYIIIALILRVIEFIVQIFSGLGSTIFVSAILGFMILKFFIKKFLGG